MEKQREIAVSVLQAMADPAASSDQPYLERRLDRALEAATLSPRDRAFCRELVLGVARNRSALDWLIARKTRKPVRSEALRAILRCGLYQIFWMDRVPDHAVVHESVELARNRRYHRETGFVNALLRNYIREKPATRQALSHLEESDLPTAASHPKWLVLRWQQRWGDVDTRRLLEWNNQSAPVIARANQLRGDAPSLLQAWNDEGVGHDAVPCEWWPAGHVHKIQSERPIPSLPSFQQGRFYIQDPSTLLAVDALNPQAGERLLDLCAAPGGKAAAMAERMNNQGRLDLFDPDLRRRERLQENIDRLGVQNASVLEAPPAADTAAYDRILIDAPCSNTGVLRRRIEARWRLEASELRRLTDLQSSLLEQATTRLKRGGTIAYSTCSLESEENTGVVERFIGLHPEYRLERARQLTPFQDQTDGAYVAILKRESW